MSIICELNTRQSECTSRRVSEREREVNDLNNNFHSINNMKNWNKLLLCLVLNKLPDYSMNERKEREKERRKYLKREMERKRERKVCLRRKTNLTEMLRDATFWYKIYLFFFLRSALWKTVTKPLPLLSRMAPLFVEEKLWKFYFYFNSFI